MKGPSSAVTLMVGVGCVAFPFILVWGLLVHAHSLRQARALEQASIDAVCLVIPAPDIALSGGARWLRAVAFEEPGAAFADGVAAPDPDPAGGFLAPPIAAWDEEARRAMAARRSP